MTGQAVYFEEEQSFSPCWFWLTLGASLLVLLAAFGPAYLAGQPAPVEAMAVSAGVVALMQLLVAALLFGMKLRVAVDGERLHVRFTPFVDRSISLAEIRSWEPRTYQPIVEYGGWGIRYGLFGKGQAYNTRGNRGVQLELNDGSRLLIGSQRAEELAQAITQARGR
ncbi:MAG: hypothetical protein JNM56_23525 [Planctomycetia bacterium]|nr:hypothetical protein [Planctomycetia bacterium]